MLEWSGGEISALRAWICLTMDVGEVEDCFQRLRTFFWVLVKTLAGEEGGEDVARVCRSPASCGMPRAGRRLLSLAWREACRCCASWRRDPWSEVVVIVSEMRIIWQSVRSKGKWIQKLLLLPA